MERFVGGLIEHFAGNFPLWLAWEQVAVIPVRETARPYADEVAALLRDKGLRVGLDAQAGDMRTRIKEATERKANYILVVGDREAAARQVSVRKRGSREEERGVALDAIVARLVAERDSKQLPADFVRPAGGPTLMADG
jgi:threonyl-tRNA synthetase